MRRQDAFEEDTVRCALIGKSFHTTAVASLLGNMLASSGHYAFGVPPVVLLERFLEELVEYEQSGGTRVVDELVDMENFGISWPSPRQRAGDRGGA